MAVYAFLFNHIRLDTVVDRTNESEPRNSRFPWPEQSSTLVKHCTHRKSEVVFSNKTTSLGVFFRKKRLMLKSRTYFYNEVTFCQLSGPVRRVS